MRQGLNSTEMQKNNRTLVLKTLLEQGGITRSRLASEIGLQKATITNIINDFFDLGIVRVDGNSASGRRGERICLCLDGIYLMSMGITRKDYQIAVYSLNGCREDIICYRFQKNEDIHFIVDQMKRQAVELRDRYGSDKILGICLAVPGPYMRRNSDGLEIFQISRFQQWSEINIRMELEGALHTPITIVHDAKLAAYAEWRNAREAKEDRHASLLTIRSRGFGIGAGIVIGGKIVEGQLGIAGEIGHMGINYNGKTNETASLESCAGTESAVRYMLQRLHEYPDTVLTEESNYGDIVEAYRANDPLAVWAIGKMAWMLGYGIVNIIYMINPDCIILGSDYPEDEKFIEKVKQVVAEHVHPLVAQSVYIRYSELNEDSFLLGGYYFLLEKLCSNNMIFEKIREIRGGDQ